MFFSRCVSLKLGTSHGKTRYKGFSSFWRKRSLYNDTCLVKPRLCVLRLGGSFQIFRCPQQNVQHNHDLRAPQISGTQHIHTYYLYDLNTCINNSKLPHVLTQYYHAFGKLLRALPMPNKKMGNLDTPEPAPNRSKDRKRKTCFTHRNFSSSSPSSVGKTACRSDFCSVEKHGEETNARRISWTLSIDRNQRVANYYRCFTVTILES